jgi:hypothetical protein
MKHLHPIIKRLLNKCPKYWGYLSKNTSFAVIEFLKENQDKINWEYLNENPSAIELIEQNLDKALHFQVKHNLFRNPKAIHIIEKNMNNLDDNDISNLNLNPNPNAVEILEKNPDLIRLEMTGNPNAIHLIEKELNKGKYKHYCLASLLSSNPNALHLLRKYKCVSLSKLKENPKSLEFIEEELQSWENWLFYPTYYNNLKSCYNTIYSIYGKDKERLMKYKDNYNYKDCLLKNINMVNYFDELFYNNIEKLTRFYYNYKTYIKKSNIIRNIISYINNGNSSLLTNILSYSDQIFIDYDPDEFKKEIIKAAYHPKRLKRWIELGYSVEDWVKD